ncbi:MAG: hypothetical protein NDJ89_18260 [Oligoflexia bacterium]|nr:hypothetical protein [Oligoflexia bacterium]
MSASKPSSRFFGVLGVLGSFALVLAFSRCSPLSPSISKSSLLPVDREAGLFPSPTPLLNANRGILQGIETRLLDSDSYASSLESLPGSARIVKLDQEQLLELGETGEVKLQLGAAETTEPMVYVQMTPAALTIQNACFSKLRMELQAVDGQGAWLLRSRHLIESGSAEFSEPAPLEAQEIALVFAR